VNSREISELTGLIARWRAAGPVTGNNNYDGGFKAGPGEAAAHLELFLSDPAGLVTSVWRLAVQESGSS
jgi:hypothetical protein